MNNPKVRLVSCENEVKHTESNTETDTTTNPKCERPVSYYGGETELWTCVFPGKMGISWKLAWNSYGTKQEAEDQASKNRNVVAIPLALWLRYKEYEHCGVVAKQKLMDELGLRLDYVQKPDSFYGEPTFVQVRPIVHRGMGSDLMALCGKVLGISGHDQVLLSYVDEQVTCLHCLRARIKENGAAKI